MVTHNEKFSELLDIIAALRSEHGCPWDKKQTPQSIARYLQEETQEVLSAIEQGSAREVCEELGDLLFLIGFLSRLYQEQGHFSITEVLVGITAKMIRRHPHVFGDTTAGSEEELRRQWLAIKATEKQAPKKV